MHRFKRRFVISAGLFLTLLAAAGTAQTFTVLHDFDYTDGREGGSLVQGADGNLYGTTWLGGTNGQGTVFRMTTSGTLTTLYNFCALSNCVDGSVPDAPLVQASDGNFYGETYSGGRQNYGTVFKVTPSGTYKTLYSFCSQTNCTDGAYPGGGLIEGTDGNLYGVTAYGGVYYSSQSNFAGTVFKISPGGKLTTLYSFCAQTGCSDGQEPFAPLLQASDGNFYGTTYEGGASGDGTVFRLTPKGVLTTLHSFDSTDGRWPTAGLIEATDGNFYGTTTYGATENDDGTAFRMSPNGVLTTIHVFCLGHCTDGARPEGLIQAADGNLYGVTESGVGGEGISGSVYKMTLSGTVTKLHQFGFDSSGGSNPSDLIQDTNGTFYAGTLQGGEGYCDYGCGIIFSLSVGLGPFVETQPTSAKVGKAVNILGTDLTSATSVTFNGTPATFTVVSPSLITTTVPAGATTGTVHVVTPGGTLSSNVPFRVIQ